jgi:hypothetical protein
MNPIDFTLWVFELCGITDVKRLEIANTLNTHFLTPLVRGRIRSASANVVAGDSTITPNRFDAVVFLTNIGFMGAGSIMRRAGISPVEAISNEQIKGLTIGQSGATAGVSEVYWNRCELLSAVCASIFHEAGHLKFRGNGAMHDQPGVLVLASHLGINPTPNNADFEVFRNAIPNAVALRTRVPL